MRFIQFKAENIHGYINMVMNFKDDLSLIIGGNGLGKTTALKLMQALISPSFEDLIKTEFSTISLKISHRGEKHSIFCSKYKDKIELGISSSNEILQFDNLNYQELRFLNSANQKKIYSEKISELPLLYRDHPVIKFITGLPSPVFLGLERKNMKRNENEYVMYFDSADKERYYSSKQSRRLYDGNLSIGLADAKYLIKEQYARSKSIDERNITKLREKLLLSSFKYRNADFIGFEESFSNWQAQSHILQKRGEIVDVVSTIDNNDLTLTSELNIFFDKLEELLNETPKLADDKIPFELFINMAQIDKIFEMVNIIVDHKAKTDNLYKKFNRFINIINRFFRDSEKKITIDTVGDIHVIRPNEKECLLSALSSGERQLLVIFAHAIFSRTKRGESVFIIDEPELSLHLSWQQIFISEILENCQNTQFIMATHSPDIVDDYDQNIIDDWRR